MRTRVIVISPARRAQALRRALRDDRKVKVDLPLVRSAPTAAASTGLVPSPTSWTWVTTSAAGRTATSFVVTAEARARALRRVLCDDSKVKVRL